ncbi:MAG: glycerol-3-phosphate dehydrogenase [Bauldia sp.]
MQGKVYDVAIIGGGLIGAAIARDAAGRGLAVYLCEEGDLGGGASSATTKLIHGALDAMEGLRLAAMREAVLEREILMRAAPHLVRPITFHIPHHERQWSRAAFRLGLFAYDHVARHSLPRAERVDLEATGAHGALQPHFTTAFAYTDCVADDSRLVILNALDARARGATIETRQHCTVAERDGGRWRLSLESTATGERSIVLAKILVNAAGPSAAEVLNHIVHARQQVRVRMAKSAHIVVRRDGAGEPAYALPNADGRIVYAVPYEAGTMLLGPATTAYTGDPSAAAVDRDDAAYLLDVANQYFHAPLYPSDIVWTFAAVTALPDDARRGRAVVIDAPPNVAPLISAFGGSLTTHRRLAEQVVDRMGKFRTIAPAWTGAAEAVLPGGGFPRGGEGDIVRALRAGYPFLPLHLAERLVSAYGTRASAVLTGARNVADLGIGFGGDLTPAEVDYLRHDEWAASAEDILWRRSKLGLVLTENEAAGLDATMTARTPARAAAESPALV